MEVRRSIGFAERATVNECGKKERWVGDVHRSNASSRPALTNACNLTGHVGFLGMSENTLRPAFQ